MIARTSPILLVLLSCGTSRVGTTWEDDRREGIVGTSSVARPMGASHTPCLLTEAVSIESENEPDLPDYHQISQELEMAILRFASRRRSISQNDPNKKTEWPQPMLAIWKKVLEQLQEGLSKPLGVLPRRVLIQARVTLEVELEITEREYGRAPEFVRLGVGAIYTRVAGHMRTAAEGLTKQRRRRHNIRMEWPVSPIIVTSPFGYRRDPILGQSEVRFHSGIDLGGRSGELIAAAAAGRVISAGWLGGHGRTVLLQHSGGYVTLYAHMKRILVSSGATVETGTPIGLIGQTGRATGPHLHFEIRRGGVPIDPMDIVGASLPYASVGAR